MTRIVTLSVEQLFRPQPGGIATYVRGLSRALATLETEPFDVVGLAPRGAAKGVVEDLALRLVRSPLPVGALTRLWPIWPAGVPRAAAIVHATSMAGPYAGGATGAVHSVAVHDLLWRDAPEAATRRGARFHERRLRLLRHRDDVRVFATSPGLIDRLADDGFTRTRLHYVRFGVDDGVVAAGVTEVRDLLRRHGVDGPFTLYAGTQEPRKNLERLVRAHEVASGAQPELGPLVLVGPAGWGSVDVRRASVLGSVPRAVLLGLYREAAVVAYVPFAEGWGLPPVEALHAGTRVVASATTPSVSANREAVLVDPHDDEAVADGLIRAIREPHDEASASRRRASVAELTWRNSALDHVRGWS
jgi:glycosyltransferase involved in cell wall biosynthesis